jgi:membrane fusion protein (multidrug efflux system)
MKKAIGYIIGAVIAAGAGFMIRGLIPAGGAPAAAQSRGQMPPPAVTAVELAERTLDIFEDHIAAVEPVQEVMVRAEVAGYIDEVHFEEGGFVKEGDLLFTIDLRRYAAQAKFSEAELASAPAELTRSEKILNRMQ